VSAREALDQLSKHGFKCSKDTVLAWKRANPNVI
jgi:hypothetical protein